MSSEKKTPPSALQSDEYCAFVVAGTRFAIPLRHALEFVRLPAVTPLPGAPAIVAGIVDIRGLNVPVINMRLRFGFPEVVADPSHFLLLVQSNQQTFALWVDNAGGVQSLSSQPLGDQSIVRTTDGSIAGLARHPDGFILVYDLDTVLSAQESGQLAQALQALDASGALP